MKEKFIVMSKRLKECRKDYQTLGKKSLSHQSLQGLLAERGVEISTDTLINYERDPSDSLPGRKGTCPGMSAENLCAFADLYGVSADFLLGRTDVKTADISDAAICAKLHLSETALAGLKYLCERYTGAVDAFFRSTTTQPVLSGNADDVFADMTLAFHEAKKAEHIDPSVGLFDRYASRYVQLNADEDQGAVVLSHAEACLYYQQSASSNFNMLLQKLLDSEGGETNAE